MILGIATCIMCYCSHPGPPQHAKHGRAWVGLVLISQGKSPASQACLDLSSQRVKERHRAIMDTPLDEGQQRAKQDILSGCNVLITGPAGTGGPPFLAVGPCTISWAVCTQLIFFHLSHRQIDPHEECHAQSGAETHQDWLDCHDWLCSRGHQWCHSAQPHG